MALHYDQLVAGNCFGQIDMTPPPASTNTKHIEKNDLEQFGYPIEHLFNLARQFLKGS